MGMGMKRMVKFLKDTGATGHYSMREMITVTRLPHSRQPAAFANKSLMPPSACLLLLKPQICFNKSCSLWHPSPSAHKFFFYGGEKSVSQSDTM